ncbi:MAG TPA: hypothetical protein VFW11_19485 [Cyclobacteriaceae bacterium]|nr:hypothetical protein [Cyclobacteriaceae bacterium]
MNRSLFFIVSLAVIISSCGDDEEPAYSFKNQNLSGKIGNAAWEFGDGYAEIFGMGDDSQLQFDLFIELDGEGCNVIPVGNEVLFSVPKKVGVYKLKADLSDMENSLFVNLFEEETTGHNLASKGAIEILTITETEVTGRIDASLDEMNTINGNFAVNICQ